MSNSNETHPIDLRELPLASLRRQITILFQEPVHYHETVADNIAYGDISAKPDLAQIEKAARAAGADAPIVKLSEGYETVLGKWFGGAELSVGEWQRVALARAFLRQASLVILDEPFAGLDPVNSQVIKDIVVDLSRGGTTILFSTHIMEQAEKLCDSVCIIARGKKVVDGTLAEVKQEHGGRHLVVALERGEGSASRLFKDRRLVANADDYGQYAELELAVGVDPQAVLAELVRIGARVNKFEIAEPTLHKIFIDLVGLEAATAPANEDCRNV